MSIYYSELLITIWLSLYKTIKLYNGTGKPVQSIPSLVIGW